MTATIERICEACGMTYSWPGVAADDQVYCCQACARGEPCTCSQHQFEHQRQQPLSGEEAEQLGMSSEPL
jgi:hypothetical protein